MIPYNKPIYIITCGTFQSLNLTGPSRSIGQLRQSTETIKCCLMVKQDNRGSFLTFFNIKLICIFLLFLLLLLWLLRPIFPCTSNKGSDPFNSSCSLWWKQIYDNCLWLVDIHLPAIVSVLSPPQFSLGFSEP